MMKWKIPAAEYNPWQAFSLLIRKDIIFQTGCVYNLTGNNGSGKTSFIKKILITQLKVYPHLQYILYFEQQIQSQFDAVNAYALLQKPAVHIHSHSDMFEYQLKLTKQMLQKEKRPVIIISDECSFTKDANHFIPELDSSQLCLINVTHQPFISENSDNITEFKFELINPNQSVVLL